MPNIASLLKTEIARVARKEIRAEIEALKKTVSAQRSQIASLRKRADAAEKQLKRLGKSGSRAAPATEAEGDDSPKMRFSAKGLKSRRKLLGLSAHELGLLLGASGQSIYKWEEGEARPRAQFLPAIAAFRSMGKREAMARLETLRGQQ